MSKSVKTAGSAAAEPKRYSATCNECGKTFSSKESFQQHDCAQKKFRCSGCGSRFSTEEGLEKHSLKCFK